MCIYIYIYILYIGLNIAMIVVLRDTYMVTVIGLILLLNTIIGTYTTINTSADMSQGGLKSISATCISECHLRQAK